MASSCLTARSASSVPVNASAVKLDQSDPSHPDLCLIQGRLRVQKLTSNLVPPSLTFQTPGILLVPAPSSMNLDNVDWLEIRGTQ